MEEFISENFLLKTKLAQRLYHGFAAAAPIIDFHCHLSAAELAADRTFENLAQLWITADPYKHRAMRIAGVPEAFITGSASDREKFDRWAATVPLTPGNPLQHWAALELKRYFGVAEALTAESAGRIWETANALLRQPQYSARGLLASRNVEVVCTSDRLLDDLSAHATLAKSAFVTRVLPSLRADDMTGVEEGDYVGWIGRLGHATGLKIDSYETFRQAVGLRLDAFAVLGCRLADHGLDDFSYRRTSDADTARLFARRLSGELLSAAEGTGLRAGILRFLGIEYGRRGWILQLHLGAQRRTSSRLRQVVGPAGGYAGIGNPTDVPSVVALLDDLEQGRCAAAYHSLSAQPGRFSGLGSAQRILCSGKFRGLGPTRARLVVQRSCGRDAGAARGHCELRAAVILRGHDHRFAQPALDGAPRVFPPHPV